MAELHAEKKKSYWLWIILAALILGIVLFVFLFQDVNVDEESDEIAEVEQVSIAPEILLNSSNVDFLHALHSPFRIKIEALV